MFVFGSFGWIDICWKINYVFFATLHANAKKETIFCSCCQQVVYLSFKSPKFVHQILRKFSFMWHEHKTSQMSVIYEKLFRCVNPNLCKKRQKNIQNLFKIKIDTSRDNILCNIVSYYDYHMVSRYIKPPVMYIYIQGNFFQKLYHRQRHKTSNNYFYYACNQRYISWITCT